MIRTAQAPEAAMQQQEASGPAAPWAGFNDVPERPALAPHVQLCGAMESGFEDQQWLIQRGGTFIQVPELFYRVAEHATGERTLAEIATAVSAATGRPLSADTIRLIIGSKLIPKGIVAKAASSPEQSSAAASGRAVRPPLGMRLRIQIVSPHVIDPITRVLQFLYLPPVLIVVLILVTIGHGWLYFVHGLDERAYDILYTLKMIPAVVPINLVAAAFHELGHAAALRYGGGQVRGMGAGLYLVYPVFFTDVTDTYRLGRWARVRTDLGGFYFTLIFALGMIALYLASGQELFLLVVVLLNVEILFQSLPFVRFDGYWVLADLTGIPDFFSQMGAFVRSVVPLPWWKGYQLPKLKGWVKGIFGMYILITGPLLALLLFRIIKSLPSAIIITWASLDKETSVFSTALQIGDIPGMATSLLHMVLLALPTVGLLLILFSIGRTVLQTLWIWSKPLPARGVFRALGTAVIMAGLMFLWLPQQSFNLVPMLRRLPYSMLRAWQSLWNLAATGSSPHQASDIGTLLVVTALALIALELCFVLFDFIGLACTTVHARWQRYTSSWRYQARSLHGVLPGRAAGEEAPRQQKVAGRLRFAAGRLEASETDLEIQDQLIAAGLDAKTAALMVLAFRASEAAAQQKAVQQVLVTSTIVSALGIIVTFGTWWAGADARITMLAGSVSLVAGMRLLRGLIQEHILRTTAPSRARHAAAGRRTPRPLREFAAWSLAGLVLLTASYGLWGSLRATPEEMVQVADLPQVPSGTIPQTTPSAPRPGVSQGMAPIAGVSERREPTPDRAALRHTSSERLIGAPEPSQGSATVPEPTGTSLTTAEPGATTAPHALPTSAPAQRTTPTPHPEGVVRAQRLNLHAGPGDQYPVLHHLVANDPLAIIGQSERRNWFKVRLSDGREGWVSGDTQLVQLNRARASIPVTSFRPMTGIVHQQWPLTGVGVLEIANRADRDGLVVLARDAQPELAAYVRAGETYTIRGIPDGTYTVLTSQGDAWDGNAFTSNVKRKRVAEPVTFMTTAQEYTIWDIRLIGASAN